MNKSVNLTKQVKTPSGPRFCTVARSANGRIKANVVVIAGHEENHPEGSCYIEMVERQHASAPVGRQECLGG
jgi:hypothetical protein